MVEKKFNLVDEPWIKVKNKQGETLEVSLRDVLIHASDYKDLAGETRTQDVAVGRFLLAFLYTTFGRYNKNGQEIDAEEEVDENVDYFFDLWISIWDEGRFPENAIEAYLERVHNRFWLFDEESPFYQSNCVSQRTMVPVAKMIGSLFESNNKPRLFSARNEDGRILTYAEAARWLLHLNCFDDIAAKKPTPKKTWVSRLGLIFIKGNNLFETLMLNYYAVSDTEREIYTCHPSWEADDRETAEPNRLISPPGDQAGLLSLLSRRICLHENNGMVDGFYLTAGDYFDEDDVFQENMTLWRYDDKNKKEAGYRPQIHLPSRQIWKEFGAIAQTAQSEKKHFRAPGVINWINKLVKEQVIGDEMLLNIATATVVYNYGQATSLPVIDLLQDELSMHAALFKEAGEAWRGRILTEIGKIEETAKAVRLLSINMQRAAGDSGDGISGEEAAVQFFAAVDEPFRLWLHDLEITFDNEQYALKLAQMIRTIAYTQGNDIAKMQGVNTLFASNGKMSSAKALNIFIGMLYKIYPDAKEVKK